MSETPKPFDSDLERQLAEFLVQRGIAVVSKFRIPGSRFIFDFVLPEPPFGVVEVKGAFYRPDATVEQMKRYSETARKHFGVSVRIYLVVFGSANVPAKESLPNGVVLCTSDNVAAIADLIEADFQAHGLRLPGRQMSRQLAATLAGDTDELSQTLSRLTINLDCLFLNKNRDVLENEILKLRDEIRCEHYTAGALRVGRSVEFIVYAACKSWDVPVREPVLVGLKKLDGRFQELKSALLEYSETEAGKEDKNRARGKFLNKTNALQKTINNILLDIDENTETAPDEKKGPINTNALLADIKNRYARLPEVRKVVESQQAPLSDLLKLRNNAAHASLEGSAREVERAELQMMIDLLNQVSHR